MDWEVVEVFEPACEVVPLAEGFRFLDLDLLLPDGADSPLFLSLDLGSLDFGSLDFPESLWGAFPDAEAEVAVAEVGSLPFPRFVDFVSLERSLLRFVLLDRGSTRSW